MIVDRYFRTCAHLLPAARALLAAPVLAAAAGKAPAKKAAFDASACYGCHAPIKEFHADGKHKGVACSSCHEGLDKHAVTQARPTTKVDPAACGSCHQKQYETRVHDDWNKSARSKIAGLRPVAEPALDKLMTPHGSRASQRAALARLHAARPIVVEPRFRRTFRAQGRLAIPDPSGGNFKVGDAITDCIPQCRSQSLQARQRGSGQPVCLSCRPRTTSSTGLHGRSGADQRSGAGPRKWLKWHVASPCPSTASFATIRTRPAAHRARRLIQALTRPERTRSGARTSAAPRSRSRTWACAAIRARSRCSTLRHQTAGRPCHVEYNGNPGTDPTTGAPIACPIRAPPLPVQGP